jgi:hypothetical protein
MVAIGPITRGLHRSSHSFPNHRATGLAAINAVTHPSAGLWVAIWWIWALIVIPAAELLPTGVTASPSFASARLLVLVLLVVAFAVEYLRRVERSSATEGLIVGLTWGLVMVVNDLGHSLMEPFDVGLYLVASAPLYLFVPLITVTVFSRLRAARATRDRLRPSA